MKPALNGAYPALTRRGASVDGAMHPTREEDHVSSTNKLRRWLVLVLAGGSLAIGVPAALAAGGERRGRAERQRARRRWSASSRTSSATPGPRGLPRARRRRLAGDSQDAGASTPAI